MEIKPYVDDIISVIAIWPVIIVIESLVIFVSELNSCFIIGIILLNVLLCFSSIRDFLYLSRTIIIDREGCTFSVWRFNKKYKWSSLKVQLCDDSNFVFSDSDVSGPGLLIYPLSAKYNKKISPMTYCRRKYPFSSVYLRFETTQNKQPTVTGKIVYYGYTAGRQEVLDYLNFLL